MRRNVRLYIYKEIIGINLLITIRVNIQKLFEINSYSLANKSNQSKKSANFPTYRRRDKVIINSNNITLYYLMFYRKYLVQMDDNLLDNSLKIGDKLGNCQFLSKKNFRI